jgi:hypothetical protein
MLSAVHDGRYWHLADLNREASDVCYGVQSGRAVLVASGLLTRKLVDSAIALEPMEPSTRSLDPAQGFPSEFDFHCR